MEHTSFEAHRREQQNFVTLALIKRNLSDTVELTSSSLDKLAWREEQLDDLEAQTEDYLESSEDFMPSKTCCCIPRWWLREIYKWNRSQWWYRWLYPKTRPAMTRRHT